MGAKMSVMAYGMGMKLGDKCRCCPGCWDVNMKKHTSLSNGHNAWVSCWCMPCRCCCDERHVVNAICERQPTPAPFIILEPGKSVTFDEYDEIVKQEENPPVYSGQYRSVDGSGNNKERPWIGQARRPYGQVLVPRQTPPNLPDADELVRALSGPREKFEADPSNTNGLVPLLAFCAIHDFFRSDAGRGEDGDGIENPNVNVHSSYLDLATLYGYDKETQHSVRTFADGRLKEDAIADSRLQSLHSARAIITLYSREHNYICEQLLTHYPDKFANEDEHLFQTARLINCAEYIHHVVSVYGAAFFGVWKNPPEMSLPNAVGTKHKKPLGFIGSAEFKLMYQWHSIVPEQWHKGRAQPGEELDVERRLKELLSVPSGRFGPGHCPKVLVEADIKALQTSRELGMGTYVDFQKLLGLGVAQKFEDLNPDRKIVEILSKAYKSVEEVEFFVGLLASRNDTSPSQFKKEHLAGSETMGFAILSDALSSFRHDRFYTTDFKPEIYTAWGYKHARTTPLADLINRHTSLKVDRGTNLTKVM
eukprot:m.171284 g.171284  ORF g.171284 m.171284 type:complete len:535 (+) comp15348_c1_seq10:101-1705(+)